MLGGQQFGRLLLMRGAAGIGLVELLVTLAIIALLATYAIPAMRGTIQTSQGRLVTQRFLQDFAWTRSQAVTGTHTLSLTVNGDCSWSSTQDSTQMTQRSFTTAQLNATAPGLTCALGSGSLPVTFSFSSQGFVGSAVALTFTAASGQTFPLQILASGSLIRVNGAS